MIRSVFALILAATVIGGSQTAGSSPHPDSGSSSAAAQQPAPSQPPTQTPSAAAAPQAPVPAPSTAASSPAPKPTATADPAATVPSTKSVITIQGVCTGTPATKTAGTASAKQASGTRSSGAPCKTVVTKAQFEKIVDAVNPGNKPMAPAQRRSLANTYVELLTFSQAATKAGIERDPNFIELMRLLRMKTLGDFYRRKLEDKDRTPPDAEVGAFYKEHIAKYEEIKLSRIFIPAKNPANANKDEWEKKASQEANELHDRAVKGEDLDKLQKEAYTTLGLTIAPPSTSMGARRRGMMAATEEQEIFDLKPGDVSKVQQEPAGYIIYKVESRDTLPVDKVKDEISRELFREKMEAQVKSVTAAVHADLNDQYFGPPTPPPAMGSQGRPVPVVPRSTAAPASQGQAPPK